MTYYIQTLLLTFIEAMCCAIFCDTFLMKRFARKKWLNRLFMCTLFLGFVGISFFPPDQYLLKAFASVILISTIAHIQYSSSWVQTSFLAVGYYGLLICIDRIMLIVIQQLLDGREKEILSDPIKATVIALLCKTILFLLIMFLNKRFKLYGSFSVITDKEWVRFLFFPIITIICMTAFAMESTEGSQAIVAASFALVLSNFLVFYIISDIVSREKDIREMRVSQERLKNQMDMYQYMEGVYSEQRKKTHEFKNYVSCIHGLLKKQNYSEALTYIEEINNNWIEEIDYINTNNAIINSILNQKFKQAKKKGIPILFSLNDLSNVAIRDEDMVTLLANLLDNAIEACEKIRNGSKVIKLRFLEEDGKITILVRNPVAESVKYSGNELVTTKKEEGEHGIGLTNIKSVVNKYGGENIWSCNGGYFTQSIIIDNVKKSKI